MTQEARDTTSKADTEKEVSVKNGFHCYLAFRYRDDLDDLSRTLPVPVL